MSAPDRPVTVASPDLSFSTDWLALREPFDQRARDRAWPGLAAPPALGAPNGRLPQVLDLGCGRGANLRWLAPRLAACGRWVAVDHDPALLTELPEAFEGWQVESRRADLVTALDALPWAGTTLVTASALLDLVGEDWLAALVQHTVVAGADALFALNVDGRHDWSPPDPDDAAIGAAFAAHQRRDKGFGPALGPDAAARVFEAFKAAGYRVAVAGSDWVLDAAAAGDAALIAGLIDGMASAAAEHQPGEGARWAAWRARRRSALATTRLVVGHLDMAATRPR